MNKDIQYAKATITTKHINRACYKTSNGIYLNV